MPIYTIIRIYGPFLPKGISFESDGRDAYTHAFSLAQTMETSVSRAPWKLFQLRHGASSGLPNNHLESRVQQRLIWRTSSIFFQVARALYVGQLQALSGPSQASCAIQRPQSPLEAPRQFSNYGLRPIKVGAQTEKIFPHISIFLAHTPSAVSSNPSRLHHRLDTTAWPCPNPTSRHREDRCWAVLQPRRANRIARRSHRHQLCAGPSNGQQPTASPHAVQSFRLGP